MSLSNPFKPTDPANGVCLRSMDEKQKRLQGLRPASESAPRPSDRKFHPSLSSASRQAEVSNMDSSGPGKCLLSLRKNHSSSEPDL